MADNGRIKGQGLVIVSGKKGSGKSHFITHSLNYLAKNFPEHGLYSNDPSLQIQGVLPAPESWLDLPHNSTVVYDEAQLLDWADNSSAKINSDERVKQLTMIRHMNINIVLVSQDPMFLHSAIRKLCDVHYHISHPFKDGKPKVFKFIGCMGTIDDKGAYKAHAVETFTHVLDNETTKLYKSVDDGATHDQKKYIPKKIKLLAFGIVLLILVVIPVAIWGFGKVYGFISSAKDTTAEQVEQSQDAMSNAITGTANPFSGGSAAALDETVKQDLHNKYLSPYTVEVATDDAVRPAAFLSMNGECKAYNKYGDKIFISNEVCQKLLDNPELIPHPRNVQSDTQFNDYEVRQDEVDYINNPPPSVDNNIDNNKG